MNTKLSIIIPVYNTPLQFLNECVKSVASQTINDHLEVIIFDDGSDASYKGEVSELVKSFNNELKIIIDGTNENRGICFARNDAARLASSNYLLLLDSDDSIHPEICEKSLKAFHDGIDLVYTNHIQTSMDGNEILQIREKQIYQFYWSKYKNTIYDPLLSATYIFHCEIIKTEVFWKLGGLRTDLLNGDEVDLHIRISELSDGDNIQLIPEQLYYYRSNPKSVVHDPEIYKRLITNIENIYVESCQRRGFDVIAAKRIGRAKSTNAAHYTLFDSKGNQVNLPYFDNTKLEFIEA